MLFISKRPKCLVICEGKPYKFHLGKYETNNEEDILLLKEHIQKFKDMGEKPPFEFVDNLPEDAKGKSKLAKTQIKEMEI